MDLKNYKLNNWNKMTIKADVEEAPEDIKLTIIYQDHGDDFVYVKTKNGEQFLYGYFLGRPFEPKNIEALEQEKRWRGYTHFLREPRSFFKHGDLSNDVFCIINNGNYIDRNTYRVVKVHDPQWKFDYLCTRLEEFYNAGVFYNRDGDRSDIRDWLELNEIATPENLEKLTKAKFSSKDEDGFDGIAGKKLVAECPNFDSVIAVYKDGNEVPKDEYILIESGAPDEYGFDSYYMPTEQFDDGIEETLVKILEEHKTELIKNLNELDFTGKSLRWLYECEKMLCSVAIYDPVEEEV